MKHNFKGKHEMNVNRRSLKYRPDRSKNNILFNYFSYLFTKKIKGVFLNSLFLIFYYNFLFQSVKKKNLRVILKEYKA